MKKLKQFFLKNWLFIILTIMATILGGIYFINKNIPRELPEKFLSLPAPLIESYPVSVFPETEQLKTITSPFPEKIAVWQVSPSSFSNEKAIKIAHFFGFFDEPTLLNEPNLGITYRWFKEEKFLSLNLRQGSISYGIDLLSYPKEIQGTLPSLPEIEEYAKKVIEEAELTPPSKINLVIRKSSYVKLVGNYFKEVSPDEDSSNLIKIEFEYKLNDKKIGGNFFLSPFLNIYIGPGPKIIRFDYYSSFDKIDYLNSYPLKPIEEVLKNLNLTPQISYLSIIGLDPDDATFFSPQDYKKLITNVVFDNIELIYYKYNPLQSYLQPVFLITGTARLKDGQEGEVGLYLPAIKEEYLLK